MNAECIGMMAVRRYHEGFGIWTRQPGAVVVAATLVEIRHSVDIGNCAGRYWHSCDAGRLCHSRASLRRVCNTRDKRSLHGCFIPFTDEIAGKAGCDESLILEQGLISGGGTIF